MGVIRTKIEDDGVRVSLFGEEYGNVARLDILLSADAVGDQDPRKCARRVADWIEKAFVALAEKEAAAKGETCTHCHGTGWPQALIAYAEQNPD